MSAAQAVKKRAGRQRVERRAPRDALLALISHTVRMQLRGVLIWGGILGLYSAAIVATYPTFGDMQGFDQFVQAYPKGLREAFNITDMSTIEGFLDTEIFSFMAPLALAFFPILAASSAIAGAEERGTIDVLLGNPIQRWQLVAGSFVATAVSLLGILAVAGLFAWITAALVDVDLSVENAVNGYLNLWPICLFFGGLALLCSAIFHRRSLAIAVPGVVLLGMYLMDVLGKVSEDLEDLRPYSLFYYYGSAIRDGIDWVNFGGITLVTLALIVLAMIAFRRRDIYT
ncbi:MAG TPA: ABC transporter permease subunit [Rubrobacteraceae bacterium]|nr:ABC transporter permease subunit [Rubrobacteraceae bacterium]